MRRIIIAFISLAAMLATFGGQAVIAGSVPPYYKCPKREKSGGLAIMYVIPQKASNMVVMFIQSSNMPIEGKILSKGIPVKISRDRIKFTTERASYEVVRKSAVLKFRLLGDKADWTSVQCSLEPGTQ